MLPSLADKVCLVTGCSRGIGKGIALQLGEAGATVYITGRTEKALNECAEEIRSRGGNPVPVIMDHANDEDVETLFTKIKTEQNGRLDVCVNNAFAAVTYIMNTQGKKFYETDPVESWDINNRVGLRGHYLCSVYASRMMVQRQQGLIVNISSMGALKYALNVAYGVGKAGTDRLTADCAEELKDKNVAVVSIWPSAVQTEIVNAKLADENTAPKMRQVLKDGETVEFSGMGIRHMAADPKVMDKTGRILMTHCLAKEYGFKDLDGNEGRDFRSLNRILETQGYTRLAQWVPDCIKFPKSLLHFASYKFY